MIDIYHSRRGKHQLCVYWNRDEEKSIADLSTWTYKTKPTGEFYSQPVSTLNNNRGQINNMISYDNDFVNITTNDDISDIKTGSVVRYLNELWYVENVQREIHNKESEFNDRVETTTYLSLRK